MLQKLRTKLLLSLLLCGPLSAVFAQTVPPPTKQKIDTSIIEEVKEGVLDNIPIVSLDENDASDGSTQNISSQLSAGRDPYFNGASFHFNAVRFRFRGYDNELFGTYMNGAPMENLDNGFSPFGLWGGLNDVMRNREVTMGLRTTTFAFGELGGNTQFDTRASRQRKQTNFNYAISNRNYVHRWMITHSTGLNKKGWAFTFSGSRRWANEGFVEGTYFDGWSAFIGIDKRVNDRHLLSLVAFAAPTENGRQNASIQEMIDITGKQFYNSFWGYQNGKKRNASVAKTFQPVAVLTHDWRINDKSTLVTAASFTFGERSVSGLDWYNAPDPRPDYYRYLPSFQTIPLLQQQTQAAIQGDINRQQLNWDRFYQVNRSSVDVIRDVNGVPGNDVTGRRSRYVLEDRIVSTTRYAVNTTLNTMIGSNIDFTSGLTFQHQNSAYFKRVNDLLGGDFYVDINQFAERVVTTDPNATQNDVSRPNRLLKKGDRFGYDYNMVTSRASGWVQAVIKFRKIDLFISGEHSYTRFQRIGNVKTGLFPNNSLGKSKAYNFFNHALKAGITYKIDGRNYLFANASMMSRAPFFENAYIAPRLRDFVQQDLQSEGIYSVEGGYVMNAPKLKLRATGYYTRFTNQMNVLTFYHEEYRNFVNYAISNIGREHAGVELGIDAKIYKGLSLNAAANIGRYFFNTRQNAVVTLDNDATTLSKETIYSENFRVPTPQEAYTIGLDYRSPKFWFVNVNFNYFNQMWLDFNPIRRTYSAVEGLDPKSDLWRNIIDQEQQDGQYTVDAFAGYSWRMNNRFKGLHKPTYLIFNVGVNNLLNNRSIVSGGFEQLRFDYTDRNPNKFPARRFYSFGLNYFASIGLRF
jgi:hypothetical protein